eukprot:TRINITY_DN362_c0_g1_i3.p1 TRINITY_DN362_c0_g1~~TRINITY_DN362_c0_g1_i3.p1  ORF type:complete len:931 (+),score=150.14 TRINITY_DN362_c0_g1_i3:353-2794(+)
MLQFREKFAQIYSHNAAPCGRQYTIGVFMRTVDGLGLFTLIENPFFQVNIVADDISLFYLPFVNGTYDQWVGTDMAFIGTYKLAKNWVPNSQINPAERDAFAALIEKFLINPPVTESNKVHVAWDVSDYQMDVVTANGREQYFRIIDRLAEFGVHHVVTSQSNTAVGVRENATDLWGWESTLWLSLGEKIREGYWYPGDPIPPTVQVMLDYAKSKGVYWMAYVYPILAFTASNEWLLNENGREFATLANVDFQEWLLKTMILFQEQLGLGGYAFDYTFFWDPYNTEYSQWKGWMNVVRGLRQLKPDMKIDNRQEAHCYGPWYMLHGSYSEPLASDENPETYAIIIPDLSTDRVAALQMRSVNFWYRQEMLLPMDIIPGFTFHQQERYFANYSLPWTDWLTRDFDYLGYQYSLISNIATAGINIVFTFLPARDQEEFDKLPAKDVEFIQQWLNFTDENIAYLKNTIPILGTPGRNNIDGNSAFLDNEGFMFLFNPNYPSMSISLKLDESVNLFPGGQWLITEIYPQNRNLNIQTYGDVLQITMDGTSALVLQFTLFNPSLLTSPVLIGTSGTVSSSLNGQIVITDVLGEVGTTSSVSVILPPNYGTVSSVSINGAIVKWLAYQNVIVISQISFPGLYFPHSAQIPLRLQDVVIRNKTRQLFEAELRLIEGPSAANDPINTIAYTSYAGSFVVPSALIEQLQNRQSEYPINWKLGDYTATWLMPQRLLLFISLYPPDDGSNVIVTIDGGWINLMKAYETRDHVTSGRFSGYYADLSLIDTDVEHQILVSIQNSGQIFSGIFFEHVETIFTSQIQQ